MVDENYSVHAKGAAYYALQLITRDWALPGDDAHGVYPVTTSLGDNKPLVTAYALKRPDATWSVLIVNKDTNSHVVQVRFDGPGASRQFAGSVKIATFGRSQYQWSGHGPTDAPSPDRGVLRTSIDFRRSVKGEHSVVVAPESLTVLRGTLSP